MINLERKKVLLTGASGGIGKAIANELSSLGADICLTGRNEEELIKLKNELEGYSDYILADLSKHNEIEKLVEDAENKLGQIDILINNAGITDDNIFLRMSDEQWSNVININLTSTFKITKAAVKGMVKRRYGRVINITDNYYDVLCNGGIISIQKNKNLKLKTTDILYSPNRELIKSKKILKIKNFKQNI